MMQQLTLDQAKALQRAEQRSTMLTDEFGSTIKIVDTLRDSSQKIGNISTVIKQIANQTNLLALNATIEAARAGDAGRGFAVVAGEVKALAKKSSDATADIQRQVTAAQSATNDVVVVIDRIRDHLTRISED